MSDQDWEYREVMGIAMNWAQYNVLNKCPWREIREGGKLVALEFDSTTIAESAVTSSVLLRGLQGLGFQGIYEMTGSITDYAATRSFNFDTDLFQYRAKPSAEPLKDYTYQGASHSKHPCNFRISGEHNIELARTMLNPEKEITDPDRLLSQIQRL